MNLRSIVWSVGLVAGTACVTTYVAAKPQDPTKMTPQQLAEMQKMMQDAQAFAEPGEEHEELADSAGTWNVETVISMRGQEMRTKGTSERTALCGGRFLLERTKGTMMGMPFEGVCITGFDNRTQEYNTVWMDSMGTYMMFASGKKGEDGWVEMTGIVKDAMSPEGRAWKTRVKHDGADKIVREVFDTMPDAPGGEAKMTKMMDTISTRKK